MDTIQVKIGRIGQLTQEFTLSDGATVADLKQVAKAAGYEVERTNFRLHGEIVDESDEVSDGDTFVLVPQVKLG